jgi:hypothetical protein
MTIQRKSGKRQGKERDRMVTQPVPIETKSFRSTSREPALPASCDSKTDSDLQQSPGAEAEEVSTKAIENRRAPKKSWRVSNSVALPPHVTELEVSALSQILARKTINTH